MYNFKCMLLFILTHILTQYYTCSSSCSFAHVCDKNESFEPVREKTNSLGFRPGGRSVYNLRSR